MNRKNQLQKEAKELGLSVDPLVGFENLINGYKKKQCEFINKEPKSNPPPISGGVMMENRIKTVIRDGKPLKKFQCRDCNVWGEIDDDQYNGRVSIQCECGFHETINFEDLCIVCSTNPKLKHDKTPNAKLCSTCATKAIFKFCQEDLMQKITITYNGEQDDEIDTRITGVLEQPPLNFEWQGQGYDFKTNIRDLTFERLF